jgi:hypothetical protein
MPKKNTINDLRDHLFETLEALKDEDKPMDLARAHAVVEVSQAIINTAKAEIDLMKAVNAAAPGNANFFGVKEESRELPECATRITRQLQGR